MNLHIPDIEVFKLLLPGCKININNQVLNRAIRAQQVEIVKILLSTFTFDLNHRDKEYATPLGTLALSLSHYYWKKQATPEMQEILTLLCEAGADPISPMSLENSSSPLYPCAIDSLLCNILLSTVP